MCSLFVGERAVVLAFRFCRVLLDSVLGDCVLYLFDICADMWNSIVSFPFLFFITFLSYIDQYVLPHDAP